MWLMLVVKVLNLDKIKLEFWINFLIFLNFLLFIFILFTFICSIRIKEVWLQGYLKFKLIFKYFFEGFVNKVQQLQFDVGYGEDIGERKIQIMILIL